MTVSDFNVQQDLVDASAEEALDPSILAYNETRQRFSSSVKADISSLTLSLNRQQEAQRKLYLSPEKLLAELL